MSIASAMARGRAYTTTLVLGGERKVSDLNPVIPFRDLAVFSETNFWALFGGRKVTIISIGN